MDQEELESSDREEKGTIMVKAVKCPSAPTNEEIERHMLTHVPFRSWCPHCVAGQSGRKGHFKTREEQKEKSEVPTVHLDYMFLTSGEEREEEDEEKSGMPILVALDQESGMTFSSVVPKKGANAYAIVRLCNDLSLLGHAKLVLKSDNEPAIISLKEAVQADSSLKIEISGRKGDKSDQVIPEESCAYDSRSNGRIESAINRVQGIVRSLKHALESRVGTKIKSDHECLPWLIRHAGFLRSRFKVDDTGKKRPMRNGRARSSRLQ